MRELTIPFVCPHCGAHMDTDVVIDEPSRSGYFGGPLSMSVPGEGCQWHPKATVSCVCGTRFSEAWQQLHLDDYVQEAESEHDDEDTAA